MFQPYRVQHDISRLFEPLFDDFFRSPSAAVRSREARRASTWETHDQGWRTRWLVPGINPEDIEVAVEQRVVSLKVPTGHAAVDEMKRHRIERNHQARHVELMLPAQADAATVQARIEHGVLEIEVEASEAAKRRRVPVLTE